MRWIAIVAMSENRVIGRDGTIPWKLPGEQKLFKKFTTGHSIVMGRKTWESLPRKPLPNRLNIILSRTLDPADLGADPAIQVLPNLNDLPAPDPAVPGKLFIIGGSEIYAQALPFCSEILLTRIFQEYEGDTLFPEFEDRFRLTETVLRTEAYQVERWTREEVAP